MSKSSKKRVVPPLRKELKQKHDEEVLTVGKFRLMFEGIFGNIKDLIQSTAKATQTVLRQDMGRMETALMGEIGGVKTRLGALEVAVTEHSKEIREMKIQISDLSLKMDKVVEKVDSHDGRLSTVETRLDTHLADHA